MGDIFQGIFGGSKSKQQASSSSRNLAYGDISNAFSPLTGLATTGADALSKLLGGDSSGFDAYKNATGFNAAAEQGSRGITANGAARGLLRSGGTAKSLQAFGNNLQDQYSGNYMDRLLAQAGLGFNAGNLISGAGGVSNSSSSGSSSNKPGIAKFLGSVMAGA